MDGEHSAVRNVFCDTLLLQAGMLLTISQIAILIRFVTLLMKK